jgi:hypothetical protein
LPSVPFLLASSFLPQQWVTRGGLVPDFVAVGYFPSLIPSDVRATLDGNGGSYVVYTEACARTPKPPPEPTWAKIAGGDYLPNLPAVCHTIRALTATGPPPNLTYPSWASAHDQISTRSMQSLHSERHDLESPIRGEFLQGISYDLLRGWQARGLPRGLVGGSAFPQPPEYPPVRIGCLRFNFHGHFVLSDEYLTGDITSIS